ncbi:hypothetical protein HanIR_Chr05g0209971 [Helianthus annuus]|nr:hypothetical protein HanIR_Chr05g0209971 [Helianthus annuus]
MGVKSFPWCEVKSKGVNWVTCRLRVVKGRESIPHGLRENILVEFVVTLCVVGLTPTTSAFNITRRGYHCVVGLTPTTSAFNITRHGHHYGRARKGCTTQDVVRLEGMGHLLYFILIYNQLYLLLQPNTTTLRLEGVV